MPSTPAGDRRPGKSPCCKLHFAASVGKGAPAAREKTVLCPRRMLCSDWRGLSARRRSACCLN
jgi:hypothetical protein